MCYIVMLTSILLKLIADFIIFSYCMLLTSLFFVPVFLPVLIVTTMQKVSKRCQTCLWFACFFNFWATLCVNNSVCTYRYAFAGFCSAATWLKCQCLLLHRNLPYLTLPSGWAGCYICPPLRPYQFSPMHNPDITRRSQWSAIKPKHRLWSRNQLRSRKITSHRGLVTCSMVVPIMQSALS